MSAARAAASLLVLVLVPLLVLLGVIALLGAPGLLLVALALVAVGRRGRDLLRARPAAGRSVELLRAQHPPLWAEVDALAAALGVGPPDRVLVVPDASVSTSTVAGRRELKVGLPLLAGTSRGQLRALLAHDLAHGVVSSGATAWAGRLRDAVLLATSALEQGAVRTVLGALVRPYLVVAGRAAQVEEQAADGLAAQVVGSQALASAVRRAVELELAWDVLQRGYVPLAASVERRPALVHGLHHVLGARSAALEEAAAGRVGQRIAALLAVPVRVADDPHGDEAACALLDGSFRRLDLLEMDLLRSACPSASWAEVAERAGAAACAERTAALGRVVAAAGLPGPATLTTVLDAIWRGTGTALVGPLVPAGVPAQERDVAERRLLTQHLVAGVEHALCRSGRFVHRIDWTGPCRLTSTCDAQQVVDVEGLMEHVLSDPAQVPELARLLERHGACLTTELEQAAVGVPALEGVASQLVGDGGRRYDLVACSTGLLVLPARRRPRRPAAFGLAAKAEQAEQRRVAALLTAGLPALRAARDARWISTQEVLAGRLHRRRGGWTLEVRVRFGLPLELRSTTDTREHGAPFDAVRALLAERSGEQAWQASGLGLRLALSA